MEDTSRLREKKVCGIVVRTKEKGNVDILDSKVLEGAGLYGAETMKII
ncbi:hypothetical protein GF319_13305 [Candidatus Bathyarchaeota archaeon]|nr:hypothetical protein [Candidatus Bathyarchaeota archaeon]